MSPQSSVGHAFDPRLIDGFTIGERRVDDATGHVEFDYALDNERFIEVVELGTSLTGLDAPRRAALDRALDVLQLFAGVSYYKAAFPPSINVRAVVMTERLAELATAVYRLGLAECALLNQFSSPVAPQLPVGGDTVQAGRLGLGRRSLVPVGGGKDSIVALETVRRDGDVLLFSVGEPAPILATVAASRLPHRTVSRQFDKHLLELNRSGAYNGHIPVTAITSMLAVIAAILEDCDEVVMSNERSASVGSLDWEGVDVNHQWSKGWDFERLLAEFITSEIATDLDYFSVLRPWSELAIAKAFAPLKQYHRAFTSCNRVFLQVSPAATWCGECDKCLFVFLALAPWLTQVELTNIVGRNLLDTPANLPSYRALLGLDGDKPFDCVGEVEESRAAVSLLAGRKDWRGNSCVRVLAAEMSPTLPGALDEVLAPRQPHAIPDRHARARDALG